MTDAPLVTIGMPVFNEERFISDSLDALTNQDYPNLEIIISDNCSTDKSSQICKDYAHKFAYIRHNKMTSNIGAAENFREVQKLSKGKYFMWAAGHDLWSENLITECAAILEKHNNAVIAFASCRWVDDSGKVIDKYSGWTDTRGMHDLARFYTVLWGNMHPILGLIRNNILNETDEFKSLLGADLILLCELALRGDFVHATNAIWSRRLFRSEETYGQRVSRYRSEDYNLFNKKWWNIIPILSLPIQLMNVVIKSNLRIHLKILNIMVLIPTMFLKYLVSR